MAEMEKTEFEFPDEAEEKASKEAIQTNVEDSPDVEVETDEIDVEVVDDTPEKDRNRRPMKEPPAEVTEEELGEYSEKVRKRLQHFSKGYNEERRAKEAALREKLELERITQHLAEENKKLKENVNKNQTALIEQAKKTVASELEQAKRAYKDAYEAGDADAIIAAQEAMTGVKLKADRIANFKIPPLQEEPDGVQTRQPAPAADPKVMEWAKANTWFGSDDEMTSYALGLHNKLVKENVDPKSDRYYEIIDSRMRELFPDRFSDEDTEPAVKPRPKASVVAPATRSVAPKKIKLTDTQVRYAKKYNIPLQEYAREVAKVQMKRD